MKRISLFLLVIICSHFSSWGQNKTEYTYQPFIMDGTCEWVITTWDFEGIKRIISNEDTLIIGKNYKKVFDIPCDQPDVKEYAGAIREENKKIFFVDYTLEGDEARENKIYDFNLKVGDKIQYDAQYPNSPVEMMEYEIAKIDTVVIGGVTRKKYYFYESQMDPGNIILYDYWMEGIGNRYVFTRPHFPLMTGFNAQLMGIFHNGELLFCESDNWCSCSDLTSISIHPSVPDFRILQNPVKDTRLSIELHDAVFSKIDIYSWDGKLLITKDIAISNGILEVPLTNLQSGNYIVIFSRADNSRESAKVIIL